MSIVSTSIVINQTPKVVRSVLLDFPGHEKWDTFIKRIESKSNLLQPGSPMEVDMVLPGESKVNAFKPVVVTNTASEFLWKGKLLLEHVFAGTHKFEFKPVDGDKTELVQSERFSGFLVPVLGWVGIMTKTKKGFEELNEGLKKYAEGLPEESLAQYHKSTASV